MSTCRLFAGDRSFPALTPAENPFRLIKIVVAAILLYASVAAALVAATGIEPRALRVVAVCWAVYGFTVALLDGIL